MAFTSLEFLLFLPIVFLIYNLVPNRRRWFIFLVCNIIFYLDTGSPVLLFALAVVTLFSYIFGLCIEKASTDKQKTFLLGGLAINILVLIIFKYLSFIITNINSLLSLFPNITQLRIPPAIPSIGISFYVFQAIAYLINVYLEIIPAEKDLGIFAVYQSFFPKLLQGPIERPEALLPQLKKPFTFDYNNVRSGLLLIGWGLFKKVVLADRLAVVVDAIFNNVSSYNGFQMTFATISFSFQIYFDFSGYTDIAIGVSRLFNIHLTENFNRPYLARNISDFWRRWHVSFSRWILDYIFKPLQIQFRGWGKWGTSIALLITFFVSGLWHGANWTFIVWGLLHGVYMVLSSLYAPLRKKIYKRLNLTKSHLAAIWQILLTFNLVTFAWIFFRANSLQDAWLVINLILEWFGALLRFSGKWLLIKPLVGQADFSHFAVTLPSFFQLQLSSFPLQTEEWIFLTFGIILYVIISDFGYKFHFFDKPTWFRWTVYYALAGILIFTVWRNIVVYTDLYTHPQFLYFKF